MQQFTCCITIGGMEDIFIIDLEAMCTDINPLKLICGTGYSPPVHQHFEMPRSMAHSSKI
jgi:hypothetical protein